jgi:hypothetical protein
LLFLRHERGTETQTANHESIDACLFVEPWSGLLNRRWELAYGTGAGGERSVRPPYTLHLSFRSCEENL